MLCQQLREHEGRGGLNADDAICIERCQQIFQDKEVQSDLALVKGNLAFIRSHIQQTESRGLGLVDSIKIEQEFKTKVKEIPGDTERVLQAKPISAGIFF